MNAAHRRPGRKNRRIKRVSRRKPPESQHVAAEDFRQDPQHRKAQGRRSGRLSYPPPDGGRHRVRERQHGRHHQNAARGHDVAHPAVNGHSTVRPRESRREVGHAPKPTESGRFPHRPAFLDGIKHRGAPDNRHKPQTVGSKPQSRGRTGNRRQQSAAHRPLSVVYREPSVHDCVSFSEVRSPPVAATTFSARKSVACRSSPRITRKRNPSISMASPLCGTCSNRSVMSPPIVSQ